MGKRHQFSEPLNILDKHYIPGNNILAGQQVQTIKIT